MIKKFITYSLVVTTMVWSVGLLATPLTVSAAVSGDLIKLQCSAGAGVNDPCRAVYYLGSNGKRYVFPNEKTFSTWYSNFSGVQVVSSTEMSSYPIGGNVTYRPGVKMIKITTDPKVYAVGSNGTLHWITDGSIAQAIFGSSWTSMIDDVSDAFFVNYSVGSDINAASDYNRQAQMDDATTINEDKNLAGGGVVNTGTGLTVSLAADTPASGVAVTNAARVPFTKINLTASPDGDAIVDNWTVVRLGLAQNSAFASVDILNGATMTPINEVGKTLNSQNMANFTEDFTIPAGTTRSVYLAGNMASSLTANSGETPILALQGLTLKGNTAVIGSLPVAGNFQNINSTVTIGTATLARGVYSNATTTTLEVGRTGYTMFAFSVAAGSTEDMSFSQVRLYQGGSASLSSDLANLKLYRDGTELATGVVSGNYVTFTFAGHTIPEGQTYQYQVKGDVVGGSARTIVLSVYRATDVLVKGLEFGYNATPTVSGTGSSSNTPVLSDNQATISTGTLRVGRSNTVAAGNITVGTDQVLGAFEFEAKGEPVNVTALTLTVASSSSTTIEDALRSVKLVDANGNTLAGPTDVTNNALTVAFSDSFTVPVGVNHIKVVGTLATNGAWATNNTITISTTPSGMTARGDVTGQTITATPSSSVSVSTQTVKTAALTVNKHSKAVAKSVITNSQNVLANSWVFDGTNSGEDVRITSLAVRASTTGKVNALTLRKGAATDCAGAIIDPINNSPVSSNNANTTSTFALSSPLVITKGTSQVVDLCVNIGSDAAAGEVDAWGLTTSAAVTATGATTGNSATITLTANNGPALTIAAGGTLEIDVDASSLSTRRIVAGSTGLSLTEIRLQADNENIDITSLVLEVADGGLTSTAAGDYTQVAKVYLKLDGAVIGNASGYVLGAATHTINLSRGDLTIPEGSVGKKLSIIADIVEIGTNKPGTANADIKVGIGTTGGANITAYGNGSNASATIDYDSSTGSAMIINKAVPQVVIQSSGNSLSGSPILARVKITAVGGTIGIHRLSFETNTTTGLSVTNGYYRLSDCPTGCDGLSAGDVLTATQTTGTYSKDAFATWSAAINGGSHGKSYLGIASGVTATVDFHASVSGQDTGDSVSTSLLGDTATTTNDTGGDPAAAFTSLNQGNFVWSDLNSDNSNSAAALTTKQWYNGYYVSGLGPNTTSTPITVSQ